MPAMFSEGASVYLAPLSPDEIDVARYVAWVNDRETVRHLGVGNFPVTAQGVLDYVRSFEGRTDGMIFAIHEKAADRHVGNIALHLIDWKDRHGEIGILIGERDARGRGYATEAIGLVVRHAFDRLGLHKLYAGVISGNEASKRAFEKNGFSVEGVLREHFFVDGAYHDAFRLGLLACEAKVSTESMKTVETLESGRSLDETGFGDRTQARPG